MAAEAVFLDTNVLIYASVCASPWHMHAVHAIEHHAAVGNDLWISTQVLREFVATLTRPQPFPLPPLAEVLAQARFFRETFRLAEDTRAVAVELDRLLQTVAAGGKQVHDANIVATMRVHGVGRLVTGNGRHFERFSPYVTIEGVERDGVTTG